jgi:hypothetical protein
MTMIMYIFLTIGAILLIQLPVFWFLHRHDTSDVGGAEFIVILLGFIVGIGLLVIAAILYYGLPVYCIWLIYLLLAIIWHGFTQGWLLNLIGRICRLFS